MNRQFAMGAATALGAAKDKPEEFKIGDVFLGRVVGIVNFQGKLVVALETGVFMRGDDDVFRQMAFEERMTATEVRLRYALGPPKMSTHEFSDRALLRGSLE